MKKPHAFQPHGITNAGSAGATAILPPRTGAPLRGKSRLAQHVTQNREDAEDVLQETFMKAYEHLDQFKGDSKFYT
jgi:hypothetical protein